MRVYFDNNPWMKIVINPIREEDTNEQEAKVVFTD